MSFSDVMIALLTVVILGTNFVAIKIGLSEFPPFLLTALRFLFAAFPAVLIVRPPKIARRYVVAFGLLLGVIQFGLLFLAIAIGMPAGVSSLVIQMQVFFSIGLASAIFEEKPSTWQVIGALIAVAGIVVIGISGTIVTGAMPLLLVLGAALAWASANVVVKMAKPTNMFAFMVWSSAVAPGPLLLLSYVEGEGMMDALSHLTWKGIGAVAFLAYPTTLLAFAFWNRLLNRYPAATVTPFGLAIPIVGMVSTSMILGEPFQPFAIVAAILVISGLALNIWGGSRERRTALKS